MNIFGQVWQWLAVPLGYIMRWCYLFVDEVLHLPIPYVFAMFLFSIVTTALMFPLSIKQQKSTARTGAMQSVMANIQKTFSNDKNRQNQEMQKLQEEMGISPFSGCLPMVFPLILMFGLVEVIYAPLKFMLRIPADLLTKLTAVTTTLMGGKIDVPRYTETYIIQHVQTNYSAFSELAANPQYAADLERIRSLQMSIGNVHLWEKPMISQPSLLWLLPAFSIIAMVISMLVTNRMNKSVSGAMGGATGKAMTFGMAALYGVFSFTYPAAFSLFWGFRSLLTIGQTALLRKFVDTEKIKQETLDKYEAMKKAKSKKEKHTVKVKDKATGQTVEKTMTTAELAKLRLQKARELDEERYKDSVTDRETAETEETKPAKDKAEMDSAQREEAETAHNQKKKKK